MKPGDSPLALWPAFASASAAETDHLIWLFTLLLVVPIFMAVTFFALRYARAAKSTAATGKTGTAGLRSAGC